MKTPHTRGPSHRQVTQIADHRSRHSWLLPLPRFSIHLLIHISDTVIQEVRRYCFCILVTYHFDWKRYSPSFVYETSRSVADSVIITIISNDNLKTKRPPVRQFTQKGATMYPEDIINNRNCTGIFYLLAIQPFVPDTT